MPDKLDRMLEDYFSLRDIRPPSLMQQQKMKQKILGYEHSRNIRWSLAAAMLFFGIIWAFNFQRKVNLAQNNNETRLITGGKRTGFQRGPIALTPALGPGILVQFIFAV